MSRGQRVAHFAADDYRPACTLAAARKGIFVTTVQASVTCPGCKTALAHPHRGPMRRDLLDPDQESAADLESARAAQQGDFEDRAYDAAAHA